MEEEELSSYLRRHSIADPHAVEEAERRVFDEAIGARTCLQPEVVESDHEPDEDAAALLDKLKRDLEINDKKDPLLQILRSPVAAPPGSSLVLPNVRRLTRGSPPPLESLVERKSGDRGTSFDATSDRLSCDTVCLAPVLPSVDYTGVDALLLTRQATDASLTIGNGLGHSQSDKKRVKDLTGSVLRTALDRGLRAAFPSGSEIEDDPPGIASIDELLDIKLKAPVRHMSQCKPINRIPD